MKGFAFGRTWKSFSSVDFMNSPGPGGYSVRKAQVVNGINEFANVEQQTVFKS